MIEIMAAAIAVLAVVIYFLARSYMRLKRRLSDVLSRKQSLSTKYGKMTEQFFPLLSEYPYDPGKFRFLGTPVDGVQFNPDGIVIVEFKASDSRLTGEQSRIRDLVSGGKVTFEEIRIPPKK